MQDVTGTGQGAVSDAKPAPAVLSQAQALEIFEKALDVLRESGTEILFANQRAGLALVLRGVVFDSVARSLVLADFGAKGQLSRPQVGTPASHELAADYYGQLLADFCVQYNGVLASVLTVAEQGLAAVRYEGADIAGADAAISAAKGLL